MSAFCLSANIHCAIEEVNRPAACVTCQLAKREYEKEREQDEKRVLFRDKYIDIMEKINARKEAWRKGIEAVAEQCEARSMRKARWAAIKRKRRTRHEAT